MPRAIRKMPDINYFTNKLNYDSNTGIFTWKNNKGKKYTAGQIAGKINKTGRWEVRLGQTLYYLHRIAYYIVTGKQPNIIDHLNGDPSDNRFCNLEDGTQSDNMKNILTPKNNTSGHIGIRKFQNGYRVEIGTKSNKKSKCFKTFEEAVEQRKQWEQELGYAFKQRKRVIS
jgi:hypothetical protein